MLRFQSECKFFVQPGDPVYEGMILGQTNKKEDLYCNICRGRKLVVVTIRGRVGSWICVRVCVAVILGLISYCACLVSIIEIDVDREIGVTLNNESEWFSTPIYLMKWRNWIELFDLSTFNVYAKRLSYKWSQWLSNSPSLSVYILPFLFVSFVIFDF